MGNYYEVDLQAARQHLEYPVVFAYTERAVREHEIATETTMHLAGLDFQPPAISVLRDQMIEGASAYAIANLDSLEPSNGQQAMLAGLQAVPDQTFLELIPGLEAAQLEPVAIRMLIEAQSTTALRQFDGTALSASAKPLKERLAGAHLVAEQLDIAPVEVFTEEQGFREFVRQQATPTELVLQQMALRTVMQPDYLMEFAQTMERQAAIILDRANPSQLSNLDAMHAEERADPECIAIHTELSQAFIRGSTVYTIMQLERFWGQDVVQTLPTDLVTELAEPLQPVPQRQPETVEIGGYRITGLDQDEADFLRMREAFVQQYFEKQGWNLADPTIEQVMEVRNQPGWRNPL